MSNSHTRSNGQGHSGRIGGKFNKLDTRLVTYDFIVLATANASQIDTKIKLPANTQAISAYVKINTAEATGVTKTLDVGVFGGTDNAFLNAVDVSATGIAGTPVQLAQDTSTNNTIGYTFGSGDFVELDCTVTLSLIVGD